MTQYFAELDARFPEGFDATGALDDAASAYNPPLGLFVIATENGTTVGWGGLQVIDDDTAELKRMWVSPDHRGRGVASRQLKRLEDEVRKTGRTTVVLDTHSSLTEAITLYDAAATRPRRATTTTRTRSGGPQKPRRGTARATPMDESDVSFGPRSLARTIAGRGAGGGAGAQAAPSLRPRARRSPGEEMRDGYQTSPRPGRRQPVDSPPDHR